MLLDTLHKLFVDRASEIENWFAAEEKGRIPPFYVSVDIRNAGYKMGVVDTNLFPAGFNNLCAYSYRLGAEQVRAYFAAYFPDVKRILVIPENNTRNPAYISNLIRLREMLQAGGLDTAVGTLIESVPESGAELQGLDDEKLLVKAIEVVEGVPHVGGVRCDAVLLNHDLSGGVPEVVRRVGVPVIPSPMLGWHNRRKSLHFDLLAQVSGRFAAHFDLDPWLLTPDWESVDKVSFEGGSPRLQEAVQRLLDRIGRNYAERGVQEKPYVFVKHDAGTYGMGVMSVHDVSEIETLSKSLRKRMRTGKGGVSIDTVLVQEGIPTRDRLRDCFGEPVIYAANNQIIGGFFRSHCDENDRSSLNRPGQIFAHLCSTPSVDLSRDEKCYHDSRYFRVYGVLARLAGLAVIAEAEALEEAA